jgi:glycosyltransferase involved in cell wall biosynthesis
MSQVSERMENRVGDQTVEPRGCAVVPAYHEAGRIGDVVRGIKGWMGDVIVVDDGSGDGTAAEAEAAGALVVRHERNMGKGTALATAFQRASQAGFDYVITMDGDGQHDPADIIAFVRTYKGAGVPVLVGNRMADVKAMPLLRLLTNKFMSWLLSREMGQSVPDTQCGYRLYELKVITGVPVTSNGYAAESEILMDLSRRGIKIGSVPVATIYGTEKSKINPVKDTVRFFAMLRRYRRTSGLRHAKP